MNDKVSPKGFNCKQCGNCCLNLSGAINVCATEEDIQLWEDNDRDDILDWVDVIQLSEDQVVYDIWVSPRTGDDVQRCPWLRKLPKQDKYICRIQDLKPEHCKKYPLSREHADTTGCKGFDGVARDKISKVGKITKADADPYKSKIESYFSRGGVTVKKNKGGYSIFYGNRNIPTARLQFTSKKDMVEVLWWSHRDKWESIGDFDGVIKSFDDALKYIDKDPLECFWQCPF